MEFNRKYELSISDLIYSSAYHQANTDFARTIWLDWEHELIRLSERRFYEKDDKDYYDRYVKKQGEEFEKRGASQVVWSKDSIGGNYISFIKETDFYLSKSKQNDNLIYELNENNFDDLYTPLFLLKLYFINVMDVFKFLDYQVTVNFNNNKEEFKQFYTLLKFYSLENECEDLFNKKNELVNDYFNLPLEYETNTSERLSELNTKKEKSISIDPKEEFDSLQKMIFFYEIGFLDFVTKQNPDKSSKHFANILTNYMTASEDTISRYYRGLIGDAKNFLDSHARQNFLKTIHSETKHKKTLALLIQSYPTLPCSTFWIDLGLTLK